MEENNLDDIFARNFNLSNMLENKRKACILVDSIEEASSTTIDLQNTILSLIKKDKISLEKYAELSAKVILYNHRFLEKSSEAIQKSVTNETITKSFITEVADLIEEYTDLFTNITQADNICNLEFAN